MGRASIISYVLYRIFGRASKPIGGTILLLLGLLLIWMGIDTRDPTAYNPSGLDRQVVYAFSIGIGLLLWGLYTLFSKEETETYNQSPEQDIPPEETKENLPEPDFQKWLDQAKDGKTFQQCPSCDKYGFFEVNQREDTTQFTCPGCGAEFELNV